MRLMYVDGRAFPAPLEITTTPFDLLLTQRVDSSALPLYISPELAETILFIGKAVWLLKHPSGEFEGQDLLPSRWGTQVLE